MPDMLVEVGERSRGTAMQPVCGSRMPDACKKD